MLLNHPRDAAPRDEIDHKLWPNDTVVEFDHSINAAIQRLRDASSHSTDKSRYVETVARRGHRFIGIVEPAAEPAAAPAIEVPALPAAARRRPPWTRTTSADNVSPTFASSPNWAAAACALSTGPRT